MLENLKERVFEANIGLKESGLVVLTWGNASARDFETGLIVIKPSGVPYSEMKADDMVVVDPTGKVVEGEYRPSSDLPTHLYLYAKYPSLGGVIHTHSTYATAFAQAGRSITPYGTTHADAFWGEVPCTRELTDEEISDSYEWNTGKVIEEVISDPLAVPAAIVKNHGAFTFGKTPEAALEYAITLEEVAKMAYLTEMINKETPRVKQALLDKHYFRKHGANATYGQKK